MAHVLWQHTESSYLHLSGTPALVCQCSFIFPSSRHQAFISSSCCTSQKPFTGNYQEREEHFPNLHFPSLSEGLNLVPNPPTSHNPYHTCLLLTLKLVLHLERATKEAKTSEERDDGKDRVRRERLPRAIACDADTHTHRDITTNTHTCTHVWRCLICGTRPHIDTITR